MLHEYQITEVMEALKNKAEVEVLVAGYDGTKSLTGFAHICPECDGDGECEYITKTYWDGDVSSRLMTCEECKGDGFIVEM